MSALLSGRHQMADALRAVCPQPVLNWREAHYYALHGEVELHFVDILCARDRDAVDVGAHDGCYVHFMRRSARHVHAFEPIPWMAEELVRKFPHGVTVHPVALSCNVGSATLYTPLEDGTPIPGCSTLSPRASSTYSSSRKIVVPTRLLDDACPGDIGFIKIDVEGHEESVIEGARRTIARHRPSLLIETLERLSPGGLGRLSAFFTEIGYSGVFVCRRRLLPVAVFDAATMQRDEDCPDLRASLDVRERFGAFIYNFIFVPEERASQTFKRIEDRIDQL